MKNTRSISYIGEKYYQFDKNSEKHRCTRGTNKIK